MDDVYIADGNRYTDSYILDLFETRLHAKYHNTWTAEKTLCRNWNYIKI